MRTWIQYKCIECSSSFEDHKGTKPRKYCSFRCYHLAQYHASPETKRKMREAKLGKKHTEEHKQKISLGNLGKKQPPHSLETRNKMRNAKLGKKLTITHRINISKSLKGENAPNWKGGISLLNNSIRGSVEYKLWREAVFKRDNFTCQECNDNSGGNLNAHHIKPFSLFPEVRFAIDNGVTLCETCHEKTESFGGKINQYIKNETYTKI